MIVGVPSETFPGERRVALIPAHLPGLTRDGLEIHVEAGAGRPAGFLDEAYRDKGARIMTSRGELFSPAEVILQVRGLGANPEAGRADLERMRPGQILVGLHEPLTALEAARDLAGRRVTAFAMELIPRITRAQALDVLSSMGTVAGYAAALLAATRLPKMFPMMMTAAGTIIPAKVLVVGAGVAGLQAIATSRRLGAMVHAYDVRPAVKEQVESVGAQFLELPLETAGSEDAAGYARAQSQEFYRKQREMMSQEVATRDVVITTAAVPGQKAPVLITREMVRGMAPGSVIIDLVAERGGNCELTRVDEEVVENGVTILGPTNLTSTVPYHASQMYSKNVCGFLSLIAKGGELKLDLDDQIVRDTLMVRDGEVVHPRVLEAMEIVPAGAAEGERA